MATPHSQRSVAEVKVKLSQDFQQFPLVELIDIVEGALKTPVQAAVKREDEQAFARLDADHDGFVTAVEGRAGRQAMREHRRERMTERRAVRPAHRQASPPAPASEEG